jgi:hypothetical protein
MENKELISHIDAIYHKVGAICDYLSSKVGNSESDDEAFRILVEAEVDLINLRTKIRKEDEK